MTPAARKALLELAELVAPGDRKVRAAVELAVDDPGAYLASHRKQLAERAVTKPRVNLAWIALVDALATAKRLTEIDHKTALEDLTWSLDKLVTLPKRKGRWTALSKRDDAEDLATEHLLELVGEQLQVERLTLAQLDMGSDAYPLVVLDPARASKVVAVANRTKLGTVELFTGARLQSLAKERAKAEATQPVAPLDPDAQRQFLGPDTKAGWITWSTEWVASDTGKRRFALHTSASASKKADGANDQQIFDSRAKRNKERERLVAQQHAAGYCELSRTEFMKKRR